MKNCMFLQSPNVVRVCEDEAVKEAREKFNERWRNKLLQWITFIIIKMSFFAYFRLKKNLRWNGNFWFFFNFLTYFVILWKKDQNKKASGPKYVLQIPENPASHRVEKWVKKVKKSQKKSKMSCSQAQKWIQDTNWVLLRTAQVHRVFTGCAFGYIRAHYLLDLSQKRETICCPI